MSQRFDYRTKQEFKNDIKICHKTELEIALRICLDQYNDAKKWPPLIPCGVNFTRRISRKSNIRCRFYHRKNQSRDYTLIAIV